MATAYAERLVAYQQAATSPVQGRAAAYVAHLDLAATVCEAVGLARCDEATEREQALRFCLELVDTCDEVRVFGGRVTAGMKREVEYAKRRGIPVRFETEVLA